MAEKKLELQKIKLVFTIVNRGKGHLFLDLIENNGVNMQLLLEGEGTAPYNLNNL